MAEPIEVDLLRAASVELQFAIPGELLRTIVRKVGMSPRAVETFLQEALRHYVQAGPVPCRPCAMKIEAAESLQLRSGS